MTLKALHIDAIDAGLAQLVEHLICNQGVTSSNLVAGTIYFNTLATLSIPLKGHWRELRDRRAIKMLRWHGFCCVS